MNGWRENEKSRRCEYVITERGEREVKRMRQSADRRGGEI